MNVLIIEPDKSLRDSLCCLMEGLRAQVFATRTAREIAPILDAAHFDLVLCADRLPDMGGLALLKEVMARHPQATAILMAVQGEEERETEARVAGVHGYLRKPFDLRALEKAMGRGVPNLGSP